MLDQLFKLILDEHTLFMQETYFHTSNADFRKHPDSYIKACILFEQYALQLISIDYSKKGIRVTGSSMIRDFETKTNYAPVEAYYKIISGSDSIAKLIMAYNRTTKSRKIFSLENDMLIIKGNINHWVDLKQVWSIKENDIVASSIDGGEEKLKETINDLNRYIADYNKQLFDKARLICAE